MSYPPRDSGTVVTLYRGEYTMCTVNLLGATISSWRIKNKEQLFMSRSTEYDGKKEHNGGIKIVFPVFAPFAQRKSTKNFNGLLWWTVESGPVKLDNKDVQAVFTTTDNAWTRSMYPVDFKMTLTVVLAEKGLRYSIEVKNTSRTTAVFHLLAQMHFKVDKLDQVVINGLRNHCYHDAREDELLRNLLLSDNEESVEIKGWTDRVYVHTRPSIFLDNGSCDIEIRKKNASDVRVWNPWLVGAKALHYFPRDFSQFVAIAVGQMVKFVHLPPGSSHTMVVNVERDPSRIMFQRIEEISQNTVPFNIKV